MPGYKVRHFLNNMKQNSEQIDIDKLLTVEQVASILHVGQATVRRLVKKLQIPIVQVSEKMYRFRSEDVAEWVKKGGVNGQTKS